MQHLLLYNKIMMKMKGKIILFMDGHASHINLELIALCQGVSIDSISSAITHHTCISSSLWMLAYISHGNAAGVAKICTKVQNGDVCSNGQ